MGFLENFRRLVGGGVSGEVRYADFERYYEGLSVGIDSDEYFEELLRRAWDLPEGWLRHRLSEEDEELPDGLRPVDRQRLPSYHQHHHPSYLDGARHSTPAQAGSGRTGKRLLRALKRSLAQCCRGDATSLYSDMVIRTYCPIPRHHDAAEVPPPLLPRETFEVTMERGTKRTAEDMEPQQAADNIMHEAASLQQVGDVRLEFGEDSENSMLASSHLLRVASPVFNRMFSSGMKEAQQGVIKVDVASTEEFKVFYSLLGPCAWSTDKVTEANADSLLAISDYYQVEVIKQACEGLLLNLPPNTTRLLQASKHGLKRQYQRCMRHLAKQCTKEDLEVLRQSAPETFFELVLQKQDTLNRLMGIKDEIAKCMASVDDMLGPFGPYSPSNRADGLLKARPKLRSLLESIENLLKELD
ncbi:KBTBD7 [Symbiodinium necroappetens]|uniref:KBTBD7 protein n=1 Tax=Symbiodinium necroappetens TaxID=1628268 RepID=A0A813B9U4_9DINO|nr:KBTBD7 [Symbiodinium necroappetens]